MRDIKFLEFTRGEQVEVKLKKEFLIGKYGGYMELSKNPLSKQLKENKWCSLENLGKFGYIYLINSDNELIKIALLIKDRSRYDYDLELPNLIWKLKNNFKK